MKKLSLLAAMLLPGLTLAQSLGTKSDVIKVPKTPMAAPAMPGGMELIQLLAAIVIVGLIIKFVLPKFIKAGKFNRKAKSIEIEESMGVGSGQVHVVRVHGRRLVVGCTTSSMTLLAELNAWPLEEEASEAAKTESAKPEEPAFFDILDEQMEDPFEKKLEASRRLSSPEFAVIEVEKPASDEMSLEEAEALLTSANKRAGLESPQPAPAPKVQEEDEILAALDRISRLGA